MSNTESTTGWKYPLPFIGLFVLGLMALALMSFTGLEEMVRVWGYQEEYSHGYLIPLITLFLLWQKSPIMRVSEFNNAWPGMLAVVVGTLLIFVGNLTTITTIIQYGALFALLGLVYSFAGRAIRPVLIPLLYLVFMIPLPGFILHNLSSELQLISSQLGVAVIRLFGISVYLEGNVIDLGVYQLHVVVACSGLNYLFPLMSIAFIVAYFFNAPLWQRAVIFLTSMPITVLMNSFRIGVIGVLVDNWGIEQAEGFLHSFEGWVVFMASLLILLLEVWLFVKFSKDGKKFDEVFAIEFPDGERSYTTVKERKITPAFVSSVVVLALGAAVSLKIEGRTEVVPERAEFSEFPDNIGSWAGRRTEMEEGPLKVLKLTDYIISDYVNDAEFVNFYTAYYDSQRGGASAHSPRSCIPGGGWRIKSFKTVELNSGTDLHQPLRVNRLLIKKGDNAQLVYYWFAQRGRNITNEYLVKWYLFWDALTKNRTDGALVRLTTPVKSGENIELADRRLAIFAEQIQPLMDKYVPR